MRPNFVDIVNDQYQARVYFSNNPYFVCEDWDRRNFYLFWLEMSSICSNFYATNAAGSCELIILIFFSSLIVKFLFFCWRRKRFFFSFVVLIIVVVVVFCGKRTIFSGFFFCRIAWFWVWELPVESFMRRILIFSVHQLSDCHNWSQIIISSSRLSISLLRSGTSSRCWS